MSFDSMIQDAGEFLPDAKKHLAVERGPYSQGGITLRELWPEPDWAARIAEGVDRKTAAVLAMLYQGFATSPMPNLTFQIPGLEHTRMYRECVAAMKGLFEQATNETLAQLQNKFQAITGVPKVSKTIPIAQLLPMYALGRFGGRAVKSPFAMTTRSMYLADAMPDLDWPENSDMLKTGICHWHKRELGTYGVGQFSGTGYAEISSPTLEKERAILVAKNAIARRLESNTAQRKAVPKKVVPADVERTGPDVRNGADVSAEQLMQRYRLRAVQFGESLSQSERQLWLNASFDALHDLTVATGLPPGWLGLSKLGLALGARGNAGAQAHYEPSLRVINLTRLSGAGSIAHEWAHGLDHHLASHTMGIASGNGAPVFLSDADLSNLAAYPVAKRSIAVAMANVMRTICVEQSQSAFAGPSNYLTASRKIEALKGSKKNYWASMRELFARAFESMIQDRLASAELCSPWLVHGTLESDLPPLAAANPYPAGVERDAIAEALDGLIEAIISSAKT